MGTVGMVNVLVGPLPKNSQDEDYYSPTRIILRRGLLFSDADYSPTRVTHPAWNGITRLGSWVIVSSVIEVSASL